MRSMITLLFVSGLVGCVTLTPAGEKVDYVTKAEAPAHCRKIGEVDVPDSGNFQMETVANSVKDAKILMRNKAAEMGANFLVIDSIERREDETSGTSYESSGRAFDCTAVPATAPAAAPVAAPAAPPAAAPAPC